MGDGLLLGRSPAIVKVRTMIATVAPRDATVLVRGESGTGKDLVAREIHGSSTRSAGPFVKIDCTALPEPLLESELFGHAKGAFTGAVRDKPGRVEQATGGTLFFDEIGELTAPLQAKLLRLLQERRFEPVGANETRSVDARFIAATHRDLETMVAQRTFREDLFYRLNVVPVWVPPLRARRGDVELLAEAFVERFSSEAGRSPVRLSAEALTRLKRERWPGNVRQLANFVERLVVLATGPVVDVAEVERELAVRVGFETDASVPVELPSTPMTGGEAPEPDAKETASVRHLSAEVRDAEQRALVRALKESGGNRSEAARLLGVSRSTLYDKLREYGLI